MAETPKYNFTIKQGGTWTVTLLLKNNNGSAKDLTNYTAKMDMRTRPGGSLLKSLGVGTGITITAAAGQIVLATTAAETLALTFEKAVFDLFLTLAAAKTCILEGEIILEKQVTQ